MFGIKIYDDQDDPQSTWKTEASEELFIPMEI